MPHKLKVVFVWLSASWVHIKCSLDRSLRLLSLALPLVSQTVTSCRDLSPLISRRAEAGEGGRKPPDPYRSAYLWIGFEQYVSM